VLTYVSMIESSRPIVWKQEGCRLSFEPPRPTFCRQTTCDSQQNHRGDLRFCDVLDALMH
jgi:hypothetical protein